ncbi:DUF1543 domain-containing protein [Flavobacterium sp.]|uniref:DUF1543 domain-containing protein n=1 Tax=Flavobacterium sp. TaxID=239 RepID=UPI0039E2639D
MQDNPKLFMVILGATPKGRLTEQHDVFFGIGHSLAALVPQMQTFWPEAEGKIHIDSWREVTSVNGYSIAVVAKNEKTEQPQLFFINLGGYKENELEEFHYKILAVADNMAEAVKQSKATTFYKHFGFKGAESHVDDKYGIDVDDIHKVNDILAADLKQNYALRIVPNANQPEDRLHIGYVKIEKLLKTVTL